MRIPALSRRTYVLVAVLTAALLPLLCMFFSQLYVGRGVGEAIAELGQASIRRKLNPGMIALFHVPCFLILCVVTLKYYAHRGAKRALFLFTGGYIGALSVLLPAHLIFWPEHYRHGPLPFPHGLEFVVGPVIALLSMAIGVLVGWTLARNLTIESDTDRQAESGSPS
jgi:hypothetical protein